MSGKWEDWLGPLTMAYIIIAIVVVSVWGVNV